MSPDSCFSNDAQRLAVLAGLSEDHLRDWRGEATILPPRLPYELSDRYNGSPTVRWCGLEVPRLWRCGNRGNVASVLIEKPARGDFLPIIDGGFSLQYSPLLEYREGRGMARESVIRNGDFRLDTEPAGMPDYWPISSGRLSGCQETTS